MYSSKERNEIIASINKAVRSTDLLEVESIYSDLIDNYPLDNYLNNREIGNIYFR